MGLQRRPHPDSEEHSPATPSYSTNSSHYDSGFLSDDDRKSLIEKGAVGDLLYNYFDIDGKLVKHPINERVVSMPIERLRSVPRRVMISGGQDKVDALIGGMKMVNANVLITNEDTAQKLLERASVPRRV